MSVCIQAIGVGWRQASIKHSSCRPNCALVTVKHSEAFLPLPSSSSTFAFLLPLSTSPLPASGCQASIKHRLCRPNCVLTTVKYSRGLPVPLCACLCVCLPLPLFFLPLPLLCLSLPIKHQSSTVLVMVLTVRWSRLSTAGAFFLCLLIPLPLPLPLAASSSLYLSLSLSLTASLCLLSSWSLCCNSGGFPHVDYCPCTLLRRAGNQPGTSCLLHAGHRRATSGACTIPANSITCNTRQNCVVSGKLLTNIRKRNFSPKQFCSYEYSLIILLCYIICAQ